MSTSDRPSGNTRPPKYLRQKRKGLPDRAYTRINGRKVYLGEYGSVESRAKYADVVARTHIVPSIPEPTGALSVSELMAAYLGHVDVYYGLKSSEWYHARAFLKGMRRHFGALAAHEFKAKKLKELREHWITIGWSRRYINEQVARLKRMFKWAVSEEMVPTDVYQSLSSVDGLRAGKCKAHDNPPVVPVSDADVENTLPHLPELVALMVRVQRLCGCRPGELARIRKKDINRSGEVWVVELSKHKTSHKGKKRFIYFGPRTQALLLPRLACGDDDLIFPMRRDSYRRAVHRACKRAGVPQWSPNQLRHSSGTAVREKMGLEAAQVHLGHARCDVTQVYAETSQSKAIEVARLIG
jgi:integrase